jgi:hypothetical protein
MQIVTLLQHHLITHDCLRMEPLLPELMCALGLVFGAKVFELVEKPLTAFALELFDYPPRGMPLEVTYNARHIGRRHNGVEVIVENDPGGDSQTFMRAAVLQRRDEDVAARRSCENGQPLNNG